MRPYAMLFAVGLVAAFLGSVLYAGTLVLLDPLLKLLFPAAGSLSNGMASPSWVQDLVAPIMSGPNPAGRLILVCLAALLLKNLATYVAAYTSVLVQEGMVRDLRKAIYAHLFQVDLAVFQKTRGGHLAAGLISDADQVKLVVVAVLAAFFQNAIMIIVTLAAMLSYSWRMTLIVLLLSPILVLGVNALQRRLKRHARMMTEQRADLLATVTERLAAIKLIRATGSEAREVKSFGAIASGYRKGVVRTQRFALLTAPIGEVFGGTLIILLLVLAGTRMMQFDAANIIVFLLLATRLQSPVKAVSQVPAQLAIAEASAERVFDLLDLPATELDPPDAIRAEFNTALTFDAVSFGYDPDTLVLQDISLQINKGEMVALVGPSGAGKTTLLELVPRFHDPVAGKVSLDGVPLPRLTRSSLRSLIAIVGQETILLHDTVRANIAYGRPEASQAEIEVAARAANAHQFITALPAGYDTILGERGTRLSGGQRQRIAIARALLRDAPILILDEATSALDTESERLVQEAIDRLVQDRTVLVIAHRLATIRNADRIVVLDHGRVVEQGSHEQLLAGNGLYSRLSELQFGSEEGTA